MMAEWIANDDGGCFCSECGCFHDDYFEPLPAQCVKCGSEMSGTSKLIVDREYRLSRIGDVNYCEEEEYPDWLLTLRNIKRRNA